MKNEDLKGKRYLENNRIVGKKKDGDGREIYRAIGNTSVIDRDQEIILPSGVSNLKEWKNIPGPIFYGHAWMTSGPPTKEQLPVGGAIDAKMTDEGIEFAWVFSDLDFAQDVKYLVDVNMLNMTSIGFIGKKWELDPVKIRDIMDGEGIQIRRDDRDNEVLPWAVATAWELLELSVVPIPANPEAEILRSMAPERREAVLSTVKSLSLREGQNQDKIPTNEVEESEESEAKANPARTRTFAENYNGKY